MKITFTLKQVQAFHALSPADQRKVLEVANNLTETSDDNIENSTIDTTAPQLAQELTENAIRRIRNRRKRRQAIEEKRKLAARQQPADKNSALSSARAKEIVISAEMSPETARHLLWVKTNFNKFSTYILEGFAALKVHPEGLRLFDQWSTVLSQLSDDMESLWKTAPYMLHTPANSQKPHSFSYQTIVN